MEAVHFQPETGAIVLRNTMKQKVEGFKEEDPLITIILPHSDQGTYLAPFEMTDRDHLPRTSKTHSSIRHIPTLATGSQRNGYEFDLQ